jgi:hypothetical protein
MMRSRKIYIVLLLLFCVNGLKIHAQHATAEAVLDRKDIRIGEQCTLKLFVRYIEGSATVNVKWPVINDSLNPAIDVLYGDTVITKLVDRASVMYEQKCQWALTCFDSGVWIIPPVAFVVNDKDTAWTLPLELNVTTVQVDTTQPIRPITGIYDVPPPPPFEQKISWLWWWIGGGVIFTAGLVLFLILRRRKNQEAESEETPGHVPMPHERILAQLNRMAIEKPWHNGDLKGHYTELTELMRSWVVERFRFPAMEMTTYQIMMRLRRTPDSGNKTSELEHVLRTADLVKFGKQVPDEYVNEKCIQHAIDFVMSTSFVAVNIAPPPNLPPQ